MKSFKLLAFVVACWVIGFRLAKMPSVTFDHMMLLSLSVLMVPALVFTYQDLKRKCG